MAARVQHSDQNTKRLEAKIAFSEFVMPDEACARGEGRAKSSDGNYRKKFFNWISALSPLKVGQFFARTFGRERQSFLPFRVRNITEQIETGRWSSSDTKATGRAQPLRIIIKVFLSLMRESFVDVVQRNRQRTWLVRLGTMIWELLLFIKHILISYNQYLPSGQHDASTHTKGVLRFTRPW